MDMGTDMGCLCTRDDQETALCLSKTGEASQQNQCLYTPKAPNFINSHNHPGTNIKQH